MREKCCAATTFESAGGSLIIADLPTFSRLGPILASHKVIGNRQLSVAGDSREPGATGTSGQNSGQFGRPYASLKRRRQPMQARIREVRPRSSHAPEFRLTPDPNEIALRPVLVPGVGGPIGSIPGYRLLTIFAYGRAFASSSDAPGGATGEWITLWKSS
jgi:hypothetical protein